MFVKNRNQTKVLRVASPRLDSNCAKVFRLPSAALKSMFCSIVSILRINRTITDRDLCFHL